MEKKQYSKLISSIPEPDISISISMGCDVGCPFIGRAFDDNWKLEDPTGKTDDNFRGVIVQCSTIINPLTDFLQLQSHILHTKCREGANYLVSKRYEYTI